MRNSSCLSATLEQRVIVPYDQRPWLKWIEYRPEPGDDLPGVAPQVPFSQCLHLRMEPYNVVPRRSLNCAAT